MLKALAIMKKVLEDGERPDPEDLAHEFGVSKASKVVKALLGECDVKVERRRTNKVGICAVRRGSRGALQSAKALANYLMGGEDYKKLSKCDYLLFALLYLVMREKASESDKNER